MQEALNNPLILLYVIFIFSVLRRNQSLISLIYSYLTDLALHIPDEKLHKSQVFQILTLLLEFFVKRRRKTGHLFELVGKMRHTAVVEFVRDLSEVEFVVQ